MSIPQEAFGFLLGQELNAGLETLTGLFTIIPQGYFDTIPIQCTISERLIDELETTEHPVQTGAQISDHSYKRMPRITIRCGWSNSRPGTSLFTPPANTAVPASFSGGQITVGSYVNNIYSQLLALQQSGTRFDVVTTMRQYTSMVISALEVLERDQATSQALLISVSCRQILVVNVSSAQLPPITNQLNPQGTAEVQQTGAQSLGAPVTPSATGSVPQTDWTAVASGF